MHDHLTHTFSQDRAPFFNQVVHSDSGKGQVAGSATTYSPLPLLKSHKLSHDSCDEDIALVDTCPLDVYDSTMVKTEAFIQHPSPSTADTQCSPGPHSMKSSDMSPPCQCKYSALKWDDNHWATLANLEDGQARIYLMKQLEQDTPATKSADGIIDYKSLGEKQKYERLIHHAISARREAREWKKLAKYWEARARGGEVSRGKTPADLITPSTSNVSEVTEPLSPERIKAVENLLRRRRGNVLVETGTSSDSVFERIGQSALVSSHSLSSTAMPSTSSSTSTVRATATETDALGGPPHNYDEVAGSKLPSINRYSKPRLSQKQLQSNVLYEVQDISHHHPTSSTKVSIHNHVSRASVMKSPPKVGFIQTS